MGKISKELFEKVFGDGKLEVEVKERHQMNNKPIVYKNRKKYDRARERRDVCQDN
jgi:hypothetical protein